MVGVAPAGGQVAAGEGAARIAEDQGAAQRGGDGALGAAEVQGLAGPAEDGGDDFGVAGESAHGGGGQVLAGVQGAGANFGGEFGVVQGEHQSGFLPALGGQVPAAQRPVGEFDQGVGHPPRVRPGVRLTAPAHAAAVAAAGPAVGGPVPGGAGGGQGVQGGAEDLPALVVQPAGQPDAAAAGDAVQFPGLLRLPVGAFELPAEQFVAVVGVDDLHDPPADPVQRLRVVVGGGVEQVFLGGGGDPPFGLGGERGEGVGDDLGVVEADPPGGQRRPGGGGVALHRPGQLHQLFGLPVGDPQQVPDPFGGAGRVVFLAGAAAIGLPDQRQHQRPGDPGQQRVRPGQQVVEFLHRQRPQPDIGTAIQRGFQIGHGVAYRMGVPHRRRVTDHVFDSTVSATLRHHSGGLFRRFLYHFPAPV